MLDVFPKVPKTCYKYKESMKSDNIGGLRTSKNDIQ